MAMVTLKPQDIRLANEIGAVANKPGVENEHGVDLLIGGHDHVSRRSRERNKSS